MKAINKIMRERDSVYGLINENKQVVDSREADSSSMEGKIHLNRVCQKWNEPVQQRSGWI